MTPQITNRDIDQAIAEGEIFCVFQPLVELASAQVRGVEALVRWRHPVMGDLLPKMFLAHVARQGRIHELTGIVIGETASAIADVRGFAPNLHWHINLDARGLSDAALDAAFNTHMRRHDAHAEAFRIDLAEADFGALTRKGRSRLRGLLERGFSLAIQGPAPAPAREYDELPITEWQVKGTDVIDLAASLNVTQSGRLNGILRACKRQGRATTAIGLSSVQDIEVARALGFDMATGFAIAKPMRLGDLRDWLAAQPGNVDATETQTLRHTA